METTKATNTAGPWMLETTDGDPDMHAVRPSWNIHNAITREFVGRYIPAQTTPEQRDSAKVNAALIAAAPALLAALEELAHAVCNVPTLTDAEMIALVGARAAIAQARGESAGGAK